MPLSTEGAPGKVGPVILHVAARRAATCAPKCDLGDGRTKIVDTMSFHTPEERDGMLKGRLRECGAGRSW